MRDELGSDSQYKYDVAFSFLERDEPLAMQLSDLLQERLSCFIYSRAQERLVATDGEATFATVFMAEARTAIILYRKEWGRTPWTRIEQTAIRNRAYDQGYDFALFIPLDERPHLPVWVPKTQIWVGLSRWGTEAAAGVIEAAVQRAGGEPRQESAVTKADRLKRRLRLEAERSAFLASPDAVVAADVERTQLNDEIQLLARSIADESAGLSFSVEVRQRRLRIRSTGYSVAVAWSQQWSDSLDRASLIIKFWRGGGDIDAHTPQRLMLCEWVYTFDRGLKSEPGWRVAPHGRFLSSKAVADLIMQELVDLISKGTARE